MELLRNWILCVTGAAVLSAVCIGVVPSGRVKKTVQLVCGVVTLLCLAYPVTDGRLDELGSFEFDFADADIFEQEAYETEQVVTRKVIEDRYEAYILDKGEKTGVEIASADVSVRWSDEGYWYPVKAEIDASFESAELSQVIAEELGIPTESIYWS
ncbi:MAG: hypothetical protein IJ017_09130 [Oscillospiraceae bacterium]|nr:hypothetical protein [Oscillospiraceae bacterium]